MPFPNKYRNRKQWSKKISANVGSKDVCYYNSTPKYGYEGFKLYFTEENADIEQQLMKVKLFESYISNNINLFSIPKIKEQSYFVIDYKLLHNDGTFITYWNDFENDLFSNAEDYLKCMGLAMHQTICNFEKENQNNGFVVNGIPVIRCRLLNVEPIIPLKNLRVNTCNKLVTIKGTVIKASGIKLLCTYMEFKCSSCGGTQLVKQLDGNYTLPTKCPSKGCRSHTNFAPQYSSINTRTLNQQVLRVQELELDDQRESGRIPRTIECELTEDLVGCCMPGDDIVITGIVKVRNSSEDTHRNKQSSIFLLYIDCISIINEKAKSQGSSSTSKMSFNTMDYYAIQKIHSEEKLFRLLVHSLCPNIYGHEMVKAGLLLALFGGTQNGLGKRQDCHVLLVGDPGLGKSQMLHACCNVAPRGVYVCGNTSTGAGLTVTVTRESKGEFSLEAGALVLADQGCCCIDEFDKMPTQHASLLEVMEQQCISIAKAGIARNLPTRASVLAAANPVGGHYTKSKTVAENLKISSPLLSRFDLIFILLDQSDEHLDMLLSEHVLALHTGRKGTTLQTSTEPSSSDNKYRLKQSLLLKKGESIHNLPHSMFRKYIAYAKKYVHPQLSDDAKEILKQFYLELRQKYHSGDCTPITARQLESMQRLAQARAKLELREEATADDAIDVVEIMRYSLVNIFTDEFGTLDFTRSPNGSGVSGKKQITKFLNILQQKSESSLKSLFNIKELQEVALHAGIAKDKFYSTIQSLNINGLLLMKGGSLYQLVSADF